MDLQLPPVHLQAAQNPRPPPLRRFAPAATPVADHRRSLHRTAPAFAPALALAGLRRRGRDVGKRRRAEESEDVEKQEAEVPTRWELLRFAAPLAAVSVTGPILSTIDTSFVGRCAGTLELAALGPACTVTDLIYLICSTISTAAINLYAGVGEDREGTGVAGWRAPPEPEWIQLSRSIDEDTKRKRFNATCVSVALCIGLTGAAVSTLLGRFLLQALGATPVMMGVAQKYVATRAVGLPLATIACAMYGLCVGKGDTKTPLIVTVYLSAVLNVFFDWLLCAVIPWGAAGAAWATVAAQVGSFVAYFTIMRRKKQLPLPSLNEFWPSWAEETKPILSIYLPVSFIVVCVLSMYAAMSGFVNQTQPLVMMAAYKSLGHGLFYQRTPVYQRFSSLIRIWITVFAFFALCADPMAAATSTKLPPFVLRRCRRSAELFCSRGASTAAGVGVAGGLLGAALLYFGAGAFTQDARVIQGAKIGVLPFVLILCIMHPTRVCQNSLVVHGDLSFYVVAQVCLSGLFFLGLTLLAGRCEIGSLSAYRSMMMATFSFYVASLCTYGARVRHLNRNLDTKGDQ
ncbi:Protein DETOXIFICATION 46 [Durusdinium trenchii]|uniref:Chloroplastic (AtDTX46) (Multidrug and toxic compound extrusion protein 46) (MATE protein 46) (Protein EDS5 HOMOLOGUE) n=1 Tax=Durusdinium trenchii TaxID=1381693 RepID=A0ABP0KKF8_9DINO